MFITELFINKRRATGMKLIGRYLLAGLALRIAIALLLPPGYDEAYYLFYGHHLAASYYDHPIMVGLLSPFDAAAESICLRLAIVLRYQIKHNARLRRN